MNGKQWLIGLALVVTSVSAAAAQDAPALATADAALSTCAAAAQAKDEALASSQADAATRLYDQLIGSGTRVADALTGKARVISQCRMAFAPMMRKGALIEDSNDLLQRALAMDSLHFAARFTLAMNYFHTPEFLGRTDDALRELEKLRTYFGDRPIPPMADVFLMLGDVHTRKGRKTDAVNAWRRGRELFPARAASFDAKLIKAGASVADSTATEQSSTSATPVYDLSPLVVEAGRFSVDDARGGSSLKRMDIVTMPGGTADVLQVFQAMPGVTRATEGSDLYVRGGDPAEAPVFLDGARLTYAGAFETLHGGIFGVLDPNAIKKADFSSGGFSARYGNALSGVLDITSDGRPLSRTWRAGVNLVSAGSTFRTPLGPNAGLWLTGKATETTALLWTQGKGDKYPRKPWSLNGMAGVTYAPGAAVEIKATALSETDQATRTVDVLGYSGTLRTSGGTHMGLLSARVLHPDGTMSLRGAASASRRSTVFALGVLDRERHDDMYTVRVDGDWSPRSTVRLRAGFEGASLQAGEDGTVPVRAELAPGSAFRTLENASADATHTGAYAEAEVGITSNLAFIAGTRTDRLPANEGWTVDPRVALAYRIDGWTLRTGAGIFHQGAWRTGYRMPSPGTPSGVATRARHFVLGVERDAPIFFRLEAYAKQYDDYTDLAGTTSPELIVQGPALDRGKATGVDALIRWKPSGAISGWASYSYLSGNVRLRETAVWAPSAIDVRHTFTGVAKLAFGDNWEIGTTTRLATGRPFTPIVGVRDNDDGSRSALYGQTHSSRLPDYMRLDTRLTRLLPTAQGMFVFYIEGLNVLDRRNIMAYTYDSSYTRRMPIESFFANRTLVVGAEAMF